MAWFSLAPPPPPPAAPVRDLSVVFSWAPLWTVYIAVAILGATILWQLYATKPAGGKGGPSRERAGPQAQAQAHPRAGFGPGGWSRA